MQNNIQQTTFWDFLKKCKIEIPIIQRDYAQGRIGKEKLRENFLTDIKNTLDVEISKNETSMYDFYICFCLGSTCAFPPSDNGRVQPLTFK